MVKYQQDLNLYSHKIKKVDSFFIGIPLLILNVEGVGAAVIVACPLVLCVRCDHSLICPCLALATCLIVIRAGAQSTATDVKMPRETRVSDCK